MDQALGLDPLVEPAEAYLDRRLRLVQPGLVAAPGLAPDEAHVLTHLGQLALATDRAVARHDGLDVHALDAVKGLDPARDVALKGQRGHVVEGNVAGEEQLLRGQVNQRVVYRVGRAAVEQLYLAFAAVKRHLRLVGQGRQRQLQPLEISGVGGTGLAHALRIGRRHGRKHLAATGLAHDLRRPEGGGAVGVVAVVMRDQKVVHGLRAGAADVADEVPGHGRRPQSVDGDVGLGSRDQTGIADVEVADPRAAGLNVGVHAVRDLFELGRPTWYARAPANHDVPPLDSGAG